MRLNDLCTQSYEIAVSKGWHDADAEEATFSDRIALMASEVAEALEAYRKVGAAQCWFVATAEVPEPVFPSLARTEKGPSDPASVENTIATAAKGVKPEGFIIEIADVMIRIAHEAGFRKLNLEMAFARIDGVSGVPWTSWLNERPMELTAFAERCDERCCWRDTDVNNQPVALEPQSLKPTPIGWSVGRLLNTITKPLMNAEDAMDPSGNPSWYSVIELARAVRACYTVAKVLNLDLNAAIAIKLAYNKTRPHRHGGKKL